MDSATDPISRALELASREREGTARGLRLGDGSARTRPAEVRYSRTRSVSVPAEILEAKHITGGLERTPLAEAYKRLRTQVLRRLREGNTNALGIASPRADDGRTAVAINLAVHAALETDWTVLLVDANLRRPALCRALGLEPLPGLSDYLLHDRPLDELLVHPGFGRCLLLPAGSPVDHSSEALGSVRMRTLVDELKHRYPDRLVLFDLPPLLESADGLAALAWAEALVLVVEEGRTSSEDVLRAAQLAGSRRLIGTVLNESRELQVHTGEKRPWWMRLLGGG